MVTSTGVLLLSLTSSFDMNLGFYLAVAAYCDSPGPQRAVVVYAGCHGYAAL